MWIQKDITLPQYSRGFHIITDEIIGSISELKELSVGIIHIFIKHTSASLAINEGADPAVRIDFETFFNKFVPENSPDFRIYLSKPAETQTETKTEQQTATSTTQGDDGEALL